MWELPYKESLVPKNWCFWTVILEKTLESPLDSKEIKSVNPKGNQAWVFIGRTDAEAEAPILWPPDSNSQLTGGKKLWCWERLRVRGEGGNRGWDGWMALPTQWTWIWANSRRQQRTGKPGVLQSMELQRVRHDWVTEQQQQKAMCVSHPENPGLQLCFNWLWLCIIFIWKVSKILELSRRWTWRNFKHYTGLWASVYANTHVYMHTRKLRGGCSQQLLVWPGTLMPLGKLSPAPSSGVKRVPIRGPHSVF